MSLDMRTREQALQPRYRIAATQVASAIEEATGLRLATRAPRPLLTRPGRHPLDNASSKGKTNHEVCNE